MYFVSRLLFFILRKIERIKSVLFNIYISKQLCSVGNKISIHFSASLLGLNKISIGDNCRIGNNMRLRAYCEYENYKYNPSIKIGNNFYAGVDCSIAAVGNILIGNNVTLASRVTIIDHSHGLGDYSDIEIPVMRRELGIKGDIIIEDNVWICEGAIILSNVRIGKNSIIGANAVVTRDIPDNSIVGGIPAKIIKKIK